MKIFRDILLIIGVMALFAYSTPFLQISAGVVQSQNVEAPPVANDALMYWGHGGETGVTPIGQNSLTVMSTDADWDTVSCGYGHCLAIKNGALYVWGTNTTGALGLNLGIGTVDTLVFIRNTPEQVGSDTDWTCVSAGGSHSLAIRAGRLYSWGLNTNGQLGQNNTTNLDVPTQVGSDTNWTWCSAGSSFSLAVKAGQLLTCGSNADFRTGLNTSSGNTLVFTVANSATTWTITSAGDRHGIAIRTDSLFSWGVNINGRTGQGTVSGSTQVPTQVGGLTGWTEIAAGNSHSLCIRNDSLYAFGAQQFGRLGNSGFTAVSITTPTLIAGSGYTDISCNGSTVAIISSATGTTNTVPAFSFAIRNDSLFGTGANSRKQLGITTATNAVATFTLLDSVNFNYKKVAAHGGGGIAIRGN
jgi:alpha-tubulin suppressor-like RCC1 family protein